MIVTLEVNNGYYLDGLSDMAQVMGIEIPALCSALITRCVDDYVQMVRRYKLATVKDMTEKAVWTDEHGKEG